MQLVATLNNKFFRAISVSEEEIEKTKESMLKDQKGLEFRAMTDREFETWQTN